MNARERALEDAFHKYIDLEEAERVDGCEHQDEFVCWHCRQRMFVLTLLPVIVAAERAAREEEREQIARLLEGHYTADARIGLRMISAEVVLELTKAVRARGAAE